MSSNKEGDAEGCIESEGRRPIAGLNRGTKQRVDMYFNLRTGGPALISSVVSEMIGEDVPSVTT